MKIWTEIKPDVKKPVTQKAQIIQFNRLGLNTHNRVMEFGVECKKTQCTVFAALCF